MLELLVLLIIKHFVVDALLQTPYQYLNKGKFLHMGGVLHAALHGIGTGLVFMNHSIPIMINAMILDAIIHYFIDFGKVNITKKYQWSEYIDDKINKPYLKIYSNHFFIAIVLDQCLHFLTYVLLVQI